MDETSRGYPPGDMRVSDADRDRAVSELGTAFRAGRLTREEFEERSEQALRARTGRELLAVLADLPPDQVPADYAWPDHAPAPRAARSLDRTRRRGVATRVAVGASAAAAVSLGALALANALGTSSAPARSALPEEILGGRIQVPNPPPVPGFDWAATVTPAVIAIALIALIVITLRATRARRVGGA